MVKDIDAIERVQHRFTRLFPDLRELPYDERLRRLQQPLRFRRLRTDLIELFKGIKGISRLNFSSMFTYAATGNSGHCLALARPAVATRNCYFYGFANRTIPIFNALPESAVTCSTVNFFKGYLGRLYAAGFFNVYL